MRCHGNRPNWAFGTAGADLISPDEVSHNVRGTPSADAANLIFGLGGRDTLLGGAGDDTVFGGAGGESIDAGDGENLIFGESGNDSIGAGFGNDTIFGGTGDDTILPESGDDLVFGGKGNDYINADGVPFLVGGSGRDTVFGGEGDDTLLGGGGPDSLYGGKGDDYLVGGNFFFDTSGDLLKGGAGDDTLWGALGPDTLSGGAGHDTFLFRPYGDIAFRSDTRFFDNPPDLILDFQQGRDVIDLSGYDSFTRGTRFFIDGEEVLLDVPPPVFLGDADEFGPGRGLQVRHEIVDGHTFIHFQGGPNTSVFSPLDAPPFEGTIELAGEYQLRESDFILS